MQSSPLEVAGGSVSCWMATEAEAQRHDPALINTGFIANIKPCPQMDVLQMQRAVPIRMSTEWGSRARQRIPLTWWDI